MAPSRRMLAPLRSSNYVCPTEHLPTVTASTETQRKPLIRYYTIIGIIIIFGFVQYSSNSKQIKDKDTDVQQGDLRIELNSETQSREEHSGMTRVSDYIKTQDDEETQQNDRIEIRDTIQSREEDNHTTRDGGETQKLDKILSSEEGNHKTPQKKRVKRIKTVDWRVGPCTRDYPIRTEPAKGFLDDVDWYRDLLAEREGYFLQCIEDLSPSDFVVESRTLIEAVKIGFPSVCKVLMEKHGFDPLYVPPGRFPNEYVFNAVQEAIRGGYADVVRVLTNHNNDLVIDDYGRTVTDYVTMVGSPIRPHDARHFLELDVSATLESSTNRRLSGVLLNEDADSLEWNNSTSSDYSDSCDLDTIHGDMSAEVFLKEYYSTGRPFVLRNAAPPEEIDLFSKPKFSIYYPPSRTLNVGPTAYPTLTGQERCIRPMSIYELENNTRCKEMPDFSMVHAHHPKPQELISLYDIYNGDPLHRSGGWRKIEEWFGSDEDFGLGWQVFFGGDTSGATLHWHLAAFNILYVGVKEWKITPPYYRGFTGMKPTVIAKRLEEEYTLSCTQHAGDQIFIPDHWGHMTINHGFTIGAAVIVNPQNRNGGRRSPFHGREEEDTGDRMRPFASEDRFHPLQRLHEKGKDYEDRMRRSPREDIPPPLPPLQPLQPLQPSCLFVHINKTGGTSLIKMLRSRCKDTYNVVKKWDVKLQHRSFHATAHSYIEYYGRKVWNDAYTFAVVRHPLARQVSNFFFLANNCERNPSNCSEGRIITGSINGVAVSKLTDEDKIKAFHEWMKNLYEKYPPNSREHYLFGSKGHGNEEYSTFSSTQTSWMVDDGGEIVVKAIFHLEDLSKDMHKLTEAIPCLASEGEGDTQLEHANATPHYPDFMLFAKDEWTRKIIKEVYAEDFKNFGYEL